MTDRIIIGQRIAELRKNKGLTQAELADRIGVSHQAVSQWERSETLPDILTLPALAEIFGESISAIMGMEDVKAKDNAENVISDEDKDEEAAENAEEAPTEEAKESGEPEITAEYTERSTEDDSGNVNIDGDGEKLDLKKDEYEVVVMKNGERVTFIMRQSVPSPTGTDIGLPVSIAVIPRDIPSVGTIDMHRTSPFPRC